MLDQNSAARGKLNNNLISWPEVVPPQPMKCKQSSGELAQVKLSLSYLPPAAYHGLSSVIIRSLRKYLQIFKQRK